MATGLVDFDMVWNSDYTLTPTGGWLAATGATLTTQRIIRRFLTNPQVTDTLGRLLALPDYLQHPLYGGGARRYVDATLYASTQQELITLFLQTVRVEAALAGTNIAVSPAPVVSITQNSQGVQLNAQVPLADGTVITIQNARIV